MTKIFNHLGLLKSSCLALILVKFESYRIIYNDFKDNIFHHKNAKYYNFLFDRFHQYTENQNLNLFKKKILKIEKCGGRRRQESYLRLQFRENVEIWSEKQQKRPSRWLHSCFCNF